MKKGLLGVLAALVIVAIGMVGCGPSKPVLHLYNWSDYINPDVITQFEEKYDCRVVTDTFDSNESMYAKLKAGATGYDLIFPSSYQVVIMMEQGMLLKLDHSKLPNIVHLDKDFSRIVADPSYEYSVPYMISSAGIAYLKNRVKDIVPSWGMFTNSAYRGRVTMLNDYRETIGAALKFLGYSLNTTNATEIAEAAQVVIGWKKNLAKFENEQYKNGVASGEFLFVHGYNGDVGQVMGENENVAFCLPREGVSLACDEMVIPVTAKEVDLAHAFINFVHDPEIAAKNIEYTYYLCPNTAAYKKLPKDVMENEVIFPPKEIRTKSESIRDLGILNSLYIKAWDKIKAAQ